MTTNQKFNISRFLQGFCSRLAIAAMSTQLVAGCGGAPDATDTGGSSPASESRPTQEASHFVMSTEIEGARYSADLTQVGDRLTGTRTVTYPDGTSTSETVDLSLAEMRDANVEQVFEEAGLGGFEVISATPSSDGVTYVLEASSGVRITVQTDADTPYGGPAAVVVAAASVLRVATVVCGVAVVANITACAIRDRCWHFKSSWKPWVLCSGSCQTCQ